MLENGGEDGMNGGWKAGIEVRYRDGTASDVMTGGVYAICRSSGNEAVFKDNIYRVG